MGMISSTTIKPGDPAPEANEYKLTLTFRFTEYDKKVNPGLGVALNRVLRDWRDGRYPFDVEMIMEGLHRSIKHAAYQVNQQAMQEKYGNEMVTSDDGRSRTARWYIEAQKMPLDMPYLHGEPEAKIERIPSRKEIAAMVAAVCGCDKKTEETLGMSDEELAS